MKNNRKVIGSLVGVEGNAFSLMEHFKRLAKQQEFNDKWISGVIEQAMKGNYEHLANTLDNNMEQE